MKIGILTYHRVPNYGALLQAVATRVVLQGLGHEVFYVDYYPKYHRDRYKYFSSYAFKHRSLKGKIRYVINSIKNYTYKKERKENFDSFIEREITPYCKPQTERYDVIIYGSDQIWRKQQESGSFNPIYFGGLLPASKHIAYAASMGIMDLTDGDKALLKKLVSNLDAIGVRELGLQKLLKNLGFENVQQVLDPTLLLRKEQWDIIIPVISLSKKYLLYYDLLRGSFSDEMVIKFAKEKHLEIIRLVGTATRKNSYYLRTSAGPDEFLNLIRNAEFVFTSSFHGLVFSIINEKNFFASFKTNAQRAESILSALGLAERLLPPIITEPPRISDINYDDVRQKIAELRGRSINYLKVNCYV